MWVPAVSIGAEYCPCALAAYKDSSVNLGPNHKDLQEQACKVRKHLIFIGWRIDRWSGGRWNRMRYTSPSGEVYYSLRDTCFRVLNHPELMKNDNMYHCWSRSTPPASISVEDRGEQKYADFQESSDIVQKYAATGIQVKSKSMALGAGLFRNKEFEDENNGRNKKRKRGQISTDLGGHINQSSMLSKLIDSDSHLLGAKVEYRNKKNGPSLKEGQIYREGIKCCCCQVVFSLSKFEAHAGSHRHRPSESLFLEDGRSLMDYRHLTSKKKQPKNQSRENNNSNGHDFLCSVCRLAGKLVMCAACPSAFHSTCLGQKEGSDDDDWYCPSCCCGFCGFRYEESGEEFRLSVNCTQCQLKYHVGCLEVKGNIFGLDSSSDQGSWFCSERCRSIYSGLQELVEKPVPIRLGSNINLTWTSFGKTNDAKNGNLRREIKKKLNLALKVMNESFDPIREGGKDIVKSVLFNKWSNLNRMNFENFYTLLLERDNHVITVATFRIHGEKVAELPLIATNYEYRGQGMCRILMRELEMKLVEFGVERLILPASHHALNTWTNSFGFSVMNDSEILGLSNYVFLNFPDTVLCRKFLGVSCNSSILKN